MKKVHKRYIVVAFVTIIVCILSYKLSASYAYNLNNRTGVLTGEDWSINIVSVSEPELVGESSLIKKIETLGNTLNFEAKLPTVDSSINFDIIIKNTGKLSGELCAMTLTGLTDLQKEYIVYTVVPLDYINFKTDDNEGSILKQNEKHMFRVTLAYQDNVNQNNLLKGNLNLGLMVAYNQK